jgi:hypothetical protein
MYTELNCAPTGVIITLAIYGKHLFLKKKAKGDSLYDKKINKLHSIFFFIDYEKNGKDCILILRV